MEKLPSLFIGHGSPYNLFEENSFTLALRAFGENFFNQYEPEAIVIISAHWLTEGTFVTAQEKPEMVYDYYNFPSHFYEYVYPAKGSKSTAIKITNHLPEIVNTTTEWGIDHAATIVLENIIPSGNITIIEMSLDIKKPPKYHFELGQKLTKLREEGILFIGSGNLIHTFREMKFNLNTEPFSWALDLDTAQKKAIDSNDINTLINYESIPLSKRGFQTLDHYLPLLYILGMKDENEKIDYIFEGIQHGSVSHRSLMVY